MVGIFIIFYLFSLRNQKTILKNQKYTLGIITSEFHHKTTGKPAGKDYEYKVRGRKYEKTASRIRTKIGSKYLIIYDSLHPNRACLLRDYEINKEIKIEYKEDGWKPNEVPINIDTIQIRKFVEKTV